MLSWGILKHIQMPVGDESMQVDGMRNSAIKGHCKHETTQSG